MSFINEDERFSNILDDDIKFSPNSQRLFEVDESSYSDIFSNKPRPLYISNENFINYFMHIDYNTPLDSSQLQKNLNPFNNKGSTNEEASSSQSNNILQKNIVNETIKINEAKNINNSNEKSKESLLKKTKRPMSKEFGIIVDTLTGITYNEEEDPVSYRKAKKRIQNRESALRMKKLREVDSNKMEEEINHLREDNIRLINENVSLKKEKVFLIEQIKFMQKIIKESHLEFKCNNECSNVDKEENTIKGPVLFYDGSKQKIKGKMFNVFVICMLSVLYIIGECSYGGENNNNGEGYKIGKEGPMQLNSVRESNNKFGFWYYLSKIILALIGILIIPWLKVIGKIPSLFKKRKYL